MELLRAGRFEKGNAACGLPSQEHYNCVPKKENDIDIAVVLNKRPKSILDTEAELFRIGMDIDVRIEPRLVDAKNDLSGFWEEISSYGTAL